MKKNTLPGIFQYEKKLLFIIAILSFACMAPALLNGFTYWDDHLYVSENPEIRNLSSIPGYFTSYLMGNYHPFVPLTHTLEYLVFGLNSWVYILNNILLHVLNAVLVFFLVRRYSQAVFPAFFAALAFGIHPLHVESVVWISERKDVLYTAFLLAGLIQWEKYRDSGEKRNAALSLLFFILSCFSKGQSVVFPVLLILAEWWRFKDFRQIRWLDKLPFFAIAIGFGIIAIYAQGSEGAVKTQNTFKLPDNILAAAWGYIFYLRKMILPWPLSAFYPYPELDKPYPGYFWSMPPLVIAVLFLGWKFRKQAPEWLWALAFYSTAIFLVLQLLPVGRAITADRYFYIPSIGLFMAAGITLQKWAERNSWKSVLNVVILLSLAWVSISAYRATRWKDTETLFKDVLKSFPDESIALNNIATMHAMRKEFEAALTYYERAVKNNPHHIEGVYNIGVLHDETARYQLSAQWFLRVFLMDSAYKDVRQKLALAHNKWGNQLRAENKPNESYTQFLTALRYNPVFAEAWSNLGNQLFYRQAYDSAEICFRKSIELKPDFAEAWSNMGSMYAVTQRLDSAISCFQASTRINPEYAAGFYNEGYAWMVKGNREKALALFRRSADLGHAPAKQQIDNMQ
jgi:protein O-mannosyl-transferase